MNDNIYSNTLQPIFHFKNHLDCILIKHARNKNIFLTMYFCYFYIVHGTLSKKIERKKNGKMVLSFISCFIYLMFDLFVRKKTDLS